MEIRRARNRDIDAIASVHVDSWRSAYRGIIPDSVLDDLDAGERRKMWATALALPHVDTFVAGEPVVGFCNLSQPRTSREGMTEPQGELTAIYIREAFWRQGLGRRLLEAALARAGERGYPVIRLWVFSENPSARGFYESLGFQQSGEERVDRSLTGTPLLEVRYELRVDSAGREAPPGGPLASRG